MYSYLYITPLCILDFVSIVGCVYLHYCLYRSNVRTDFRNIKKIDITDGILKFYSVIAPIAIFCGLIYGNIAVFELYPENVNPWFCYMSQYICQLSFLYLAAFSLSIAIMRYIFIVHYDKAIAIGMDKLKHRFLVLHSIMPIMIAALHVVSTGNVDPMMTVNKCWKQETQNSPDILCRDRKYEVGQYLGEELGHYKELMLRPLCVGVSGLYILSTCNVAEIVFYLAIYRFLKR